MSTPRGDKYGTALKAADWRDNEEAVALLLERGVDINTKGKFGTAPRIAGWKEDEKVVRLLLERGADATPWG